MTMNATGGNPSLPTMLKPVTIAQQPSNQDAEPNTVCTTLNRGRRLWERPGLKDP